jgi:hypothetical protein
VHIRVGYLLSSTSYGGHLDGVQFPTENDCKSCRYAKENGHFHIVDFLVSRGVISDM